MAKYEMPVIDIPKEDVKVNVNMAQDAYSVSFILCCPFRYFKGHRPEQNGADVEAYL